MADRKNIEIQCSACGRESLLVRKPRFEGFRKVGEMLSCSTCGHAYASEAEVPFIVRKEPHVFTEADRSAAVRVFEEGEAATLCRHCAHYVVNPFLQWCAVHKKEVEATDSCDRFARKPEAPRPKG